MSKKIKDLTGKKIGDLIVLSFYGFQKPDSKKDRKPSWLCRCCLCNKEHVVRAGSLNCKNHVSSCFACARKFNGLKYSNLIGQKFGRLLVLAKAEKPENVSNGSQYWYVRCDCGVEKKVCTGSLKQGLTISCGCYNRENARRVHTTHGLSKNYGEYNKMRREDPVEHLKHKVGTAIRHYLQANGYKKLGSIWDVLPYTPQQLKDHLESLWEPWMNWSNYGGASTDPRKTWWLDHIKPQSAFLYTSIHDPLFLECWALDNLQPLEKIANMVKGKKYFK